MRSTGPTICLDFSPDPSAYEFLQIVSALAARRQLDDDFRLEYAKLWQSLVMADERGIRSAAAAMNAGAMAELFAGMLTNRPWDQACTWMPLFHCFRLSSVCHQSAPELKGSLCTSCAAWPEEPSGARNEKQATG